MDYSTKIFLFISRQYMIIPITETNQEIFLA